MGKVVCFIVLLFLVTPLYAQSYDVLTAGLTFNSEIYFNYLKGKWVKEEFDKDTIDFRSAGHLVLALVHEKKGHIGPHCDYNYGFEKYSKVSDYTGIYFSFIPKHIEQIPTQPGPEPYVWHYVLDTIQHYLIIGNFYDAPDDNGYEADLCFRKLE